MIWRPVTKKSPHTLRDLVDSHGTGPFRRVWFLGEETCEVVADREV
jgi:hypothetical protein